MSSGFRRYEVLLPLKFNDGAEVPDELISDTLTELRIRLGSVSSETQTIRGQWVHKGQTYVTTCCASLSTWKILPKLPTSFADTKRV